jgi:hypothetical protein
MFIPDAGLIATLHTASERLRSNSVMGTLNNCRMSRHWGFARRFFGSENRMPGAL